LDDPLVNEFYVINVTLNDLYLYTQAWEEDIRAMRKTDIPLHRMMEVFIGGSSILGGIIFLFIGCCICKFCRKENQGEGAKGEKI
jgi:hypothetical protein